METVVDFIFWGSIITVDSAAMILKTLAPWTKVMTNPDGICRSRDIIVQANVCIVKAMVFPVVRYECESWAIKKNKCKRIGAFELQCCRRLLRVPWPERRSNQLILKEINPEYLLEGKILKLKLQYFGHLTWRAVYIYISWYVFTLYFYQNRKTSWSHSSQYLPPGLMINRSNIDQEISHSNYYRILSDAI